MSVYERELHILSSDVDMYRRLRLSVLFSRMQEAAVAHTEQLGMGRDKTLDRGVLWVVTLQSAQIRRMPEYDERVVLRSWPGKTMHVLFPRYCSIDTEAGEPLIRASALWTLLDARTRKLAFPGEHGIKVEGVTTGDEIDLPSAPVPVECPETRDFTVPFSYVDLNGHMNNTRYFDLAEDCLPCAAQGRLLTAVSAEFSREARFGQTLPLRWGHDGGRWYFSGGGGAGEKPLFRMSLTYRPAER